MRKLAFLVGVLMSPLLYAESGVSSTHIYWAMSCGAYLQSASGSVSRHFALAYARGAITTYNLYNPEKQIQRELPNATVDAYFEKFCREHPLDDAAYGAFKLIRELGGEPPAGLQ